MMSGATHGVVGDLDEPTVVPQTEVPEEELTKEKKELENLAKFSKTAEYKKLKQYMEDRIEFFQNFLPTGELVEGDPKDPRTMFSVNVPRGDLTANWIAACIVIKELNNVIRAYENAAESVQQR